MTRGESLRAYCERMDFGALLDEWDAERNAPLTPETVSAHSRRKVWWRCREGHCWASSLDIRTSGTGCPYCAGKRPAAGETDLASLYPSLASEWSERNTLKPTDVTPGSGKKVWWRCENGHEWQASVFARTLGTGCPVCSGRRVIPGVNDLASAYPAIAAQWSRKNGSLLPTQLRPFSNRRVWWECERGHSWQATVNTRVSNSSGCPYCANKKLLPGFNDLQTRFPELAAQWHPTLNGDKTPERVIAGSHYKAWWRCPEGHVWQAEIASRVGKKRPGCPLCAGNVSKEWRARYERELAGIQRADGFLLAER